MRKSRGAGTDTNIYGHGPLLCLSVPLTAMPTTGELQTHPPASPHEVPGKQRNRWAQAKGGAKVRGNNTE